MDRDEHVEGTPPEIVQQGVARARPYPSAEMARSVFLSAPIGMGVAAGRVIVEVNQQLCDMLGYTRDELLGQSARRLYADATEFARVGRMQPGPLSPEQVLAETQMVRKDGQRIDVELAALPIADSGDALVFTALDVSQRRQAERFLHRQLELLARISETEELEELLEVSLAAAIQQSGMDCGGIYLVDAESGDFRLAAHRALSATFLEHVSRIAGDSAQGRLVHAKRSQYSTHAELLGAAGTSGETLRALAVVPIVNRNRVIGCLNVASHTLDQVPESARTGLAAVAGQVGSFIDRAVAEHKLRASEARYRELADSLPHAVFEASTDGTVQFFNRDAYGMFGYSPEDVAKGLSLLALVVEEERPHALANIAGLLAGKSMPTREYTCRRKDGTEFPVEVSTNVVIRDGRAVGLRGIIMDTSARKKAEAERSLLEEQLRQSQKMESIGRLAGGVAHDFNNILTGILGFASLVQSALSGQDPVQVDLLEISKAAKRASELTAQLLAFSRKQIIDPRVINLNAQVAASSAMLKRIVGEDVELRFVPDEALWHVKVDPGQLEQALVNLVVNARDAMPDGGKLLIETANVNVDDNYVKLHPDATAGEFVAIQVSDTGSGMPPEVRRRLFEPFFTTKEKGRGTGLGLSTVYGIIRQNSGFINVYSELGVGTTFKLYLPRVLAEVDWIEPASHRPSSRGTETILVVEDEAVVRKLVHRMLKRFGYRVRAFPSADEVRHWLQNHDDEVDLLLTDVILPGTNGRVLYDQLASLRPRLKVLFMSGYTENVIAHRGVLEEGTHFIQKPFSTEDLLSKLRVVLEA